MSLTVLKELKLGSMMMSMETLKVTSVVKDDVDVGVEGVPDVPVDCSEARSKMWSPCTGWNTSNGLSYSLA